MGFNDLHLDLKNIVSSFAFDCKWVIVEKDLKICEMVMQMNISPVFTRRIMWSAMYMDYIPNPLLEFEPIQNYTGFWGDYIDWHAVNELLWRLDFRRKFVKMIYSRTEWRLLFKASWKNIEMFDSFYRFLLYTRVPCFKPLWKPCGFNCLQSIRTFVSARWWVND